MSRNFRLLPLLLSLLPRLLDNRPSVLVFGRGPSLVLGCDHGLDAEATGQTGIASPAGCTLSASGLRTWGVAVV